MFYKIIHIHYLCHRIYLLNYAVCVVLLNIICLKSTYKWKLTNIQRGYKPLIPTVDSIDLTDYRLVISQQFSSR
ncbi:uncharacterized protein DC041_0000440 [Schistosoma bovis]|uniref:Uncharacterized protein n=1 Tax=Schistosoma bovis TaxID=6184 RepID=A0A430QNB8_SCHBO|nr:uncharacterized protein DC041_0000440 [Schistosoma bovis]